MQGESHRLATLPICACSSTIKWHKDDSADHKQRNQIASHQRRIEHLLKVSSNRENSSLDWNLNVALHYCFRIRQHRWKCRLCYYYSSSYLDLIPSPAYSPLNNLRHVRIGHFPEKYRYGFWLNSKNLLKKGPIVNFFFLASWWWQLKDEWNRPLRS